ncbi:MAG: D-alanyl-D-alanine carboxypeptidase [Chitinophagaceae bacterium]|nr:D-alanyl-D-alanine carboxypeptidase [Chitinophagaceae bacterium]
MKLHHSIFLVPCSVFILASCSVSKQISKQANTILLNDTAISTGHIGISIYEPATGKYWYNYDATKYFIPASNTKLFTLYAGMKYLGDSLVAARLKTAGASVSVYPSGDPTFLNPEFEFQPLFNNLASFKIIYINNNTWRSDALGNGWAWNDYGDYYMAERSSFPIYNNLIDFSLKNGTIAVSNKAIEILSRERSGSPIQFNPETKKAASDKFIIERSYENNDFYIKDANSSFRKKSIPFKTDPEFVAALLKDTLKVEDVTFFRSDAPGNIISGISIIHSQPADSLFKPMMHRSDNFFAEQTLLMASNERLGYMNDEAMIDTLLRTDLKDVPQKPKWVDGSGLSRYNLFTPQSFVYILNKMKNEFGWDRIKNILPTGGTGTLASYYKKEAGFIYAKTGTLSNNCSLSGYMITKKGKFLIFSVLANNYSTGATPVRKAVEQFLVGIREKY